jgi:very-short-patch-repair endonuclease
MRGDHAAGVEEAIRWVVDAQEGVVSRRQLLARGLGPAAVDWRLRTRRLRPLFAGVYALGHAALTDRAWCIAALLAGGESAVISHETAAWRWRIGSRALLLHVTSPTHRAARRGHLRVHEGALRPIDVAEVDGLAATSIGRTIVDLMATSSEYELARLLDEAYNAHRFTPVDLAPMAGRRGAPKLRRALARRGIGVHITDSDLERRFLDILRAAHLPEPETQVRLGPTRVDTLWADLALVVEVDGPVHLAPGKALRDRENERALRLLGFRVERVNWIEILHHPRAVAELVAGWIDSQRRAAA